MVLASPQAVFLQLGRCGRRKSSSPRNRRRSDPPGPGSSGPGPRWRLSGADTIGPREFRNHHLAEWWQQGRECRAGLRSERRSDLFEPEKEKNRGCPMWADCRFNHQSMGGFKGKGARYVAVRQIIPVDGAKGGSQDIKRCFDYVLTLQARADAGAAERRVTNGRRGEVIRIIGQEGDSFTTQWYVGFNAKNEVIQPKPEDIPILKRTRSTTRRW